MKVEFDYSHFHMLKSDLALDGYWEIGKLLSVLINGDFSFSHA